MRLSKILAGLTFIFFFLIANVANAAASTLTLNPNSGTVNKGCVLTVKIDLNTQGANTDGTDAVLFYDPSKFTVTTGSITNGTIYPDFPGNVVDSQNGKISISGLASVSQGFNGSGTLATINFQVNDAATAGTTQIRFDFDPNNKSKTTDSNVVERGTVVDTLNAVTDGTYTIGTGSCNGVASPTPSPSSGLPGGRGGPGGVGSGSGTVNTGPGATPLPSAALTGPTLVLTIIGVGLTVLGIIGLALL